MQQEIDNLKHENRLLIASIEQSPVLINRFTSQGEIIYVNDAYCNFFERTREELLGASVKKNVLAEEAESLKKLLDALNPDMEPFIFINSIHDSTGNRRWIQWTAFPVLGPDNRVEYQSIGQDITKRKETEKQLSLQTAYFKQLFESSPEAMVILDKNGRVADVNPGFEKLFLFTLAEVRGKFLDELVAQPELKLEAEEISQKVINNENIQSETVRKRKDGSLVHVSILGAPIRLGKAHMGVFGIYRDISERKAAEAKMQASLKEKEVLLKEIYHRVKNNLQVISSLLNLQAIRFADDNIRTLFEESQSRIQSMALVHECLYLSPNLARINVNEYIQKLTVFLFDMFAAQGRTIPKLIQKVDEIDLSMDLAVPCGLIINELVSNALKYAFKGPAEGVLRIVLFRENRGTVKLAVCDNGIGLPEDFNINQLNSLGVSLVVSLVDQLGGSITYTSRKTRPEKTAGTCWYITFPCGG